jgi:hypothetical protein
MRAGREFVRILVVGRCHRRSRFPGVISFGREAGFSVGFAPQTVHRCSNSARGGGRNRSGRCQDDPSTQGDSPLIRRHPDTDRHCHGPPPQCRRRKSPSSALLLRPIVFISCDTCLFRQGRKQKDIRVSLRDSQDGARQPRRTVPCHPRPPCIEGGRTDPPAADRKCPHTRRTLPHGLARIRPANAQPWHQGRDRPQSVSGIFRQRTESASTAIGVAVPRGETRERRTGSRNRGLRAQAARPRRG